MNKQSFRDILAQQVAEYAKNNEVLIYAESASQRDAIKRAMKVGKAPPNLVEEEFNEYLAKLKAGTYRTQYQPTEDLWEITE